MGRQKQVVRHSGEWGLMWLLTILAQPCAVLMGRGRELDTKSYWNDQVEFDTSAIWRQ
jgi:hypothetical protein